MIGPEFVGDADLYASSRNRFVWTFQSRVQVQPQEIGVEGLKGAGPRVRATAVDMSGNGWMARPSLSMSSPWMVLFHLRFTCHVDFVSPQSLAVKRLYFFESLTAMYSRPPWFCIADL